MSTNASAAVEGTDTDQLLDERDVRALTQYLTVLEEGPDVYTVTSQSGETYTVDVRDGRCECPDHQYRGVRCKHLRRVAFETGAEPIPAEYADELPRDFAQHVDGEPTIAATDGGTSPDTRADPADRADEGEELVVTATDGGLLVYAIEREYRPHLGRDTEVARRLIGFADVTDWDTIAEAARARGHSHGDVLHLPVLEDVTRRSD